MHIAPSQPETFGSLRSKRAFTMIEMMVSAVAGLMILGSMAAVFLFMNRSLNGAGNYEELDRESRQALDLMSRDIRQASCLTNFTSTSLTFTNQDGTLLQYSYDGTNNVNFTNGSIGIGGILLSNCLYLNFNIFQRTPSNGTTMTFWPAYATNCTQAKVVVINWICARTNYSMQTDSESVQTAKIVMRN